MITWRWSSTVRGPRLFHDVTPSATSTVNAARIRATPSPRAIIDLSTQEGSLHR